MLHSEDLDLDLDLESVNAINWKSLTEDGFRM